MQKVNKLLLAALILFGFQTGLAGGIDWEHGSWNEAIAKAKKENKVVFLDAYTTWCGPCKWMSANVTNQSEVGEFFNENFISVKMDMEAGEGLELAKKYQVRAYPSLLFVDGEGRIVHRTVGAKPVEEFLALGQQVMDMEMPYYAMVERYESGKYDRDFEFNYLMYLADAYMDTGDVLEKYAEGMNTKNMTEANNWEVFKRLYHRVDTDEFKYFESNMDDFVAQFGKEIVEDKYYTNYLRSISMKVRNEDWKAFDKLAKKIDGKGSEKVQQSLMAMRIAKAEKTMETADFAMQLTTWVGEGQPIDAMTLNRYAWGFYENQDDPKMIKLATSWAIQSVKLDPGYANIDTYAMLLKKMGDTNGAIVQCKRAIEFAEDSGEDYSETQKELDALRAAKQ